MKKNYSHWFIALAMLIGLQGCQSTKTENELATVDLSKTYPEKIIKLQDVFDVEYVPLETKEDFITGGEVLAIGDALIVTVNNAMEGTLFLFDRHTGKALRTINRKGQGAEEYLFTTDVLLDEANGELYVNDTPSKKVLVYDLYGNFKRKLEVQEGCQYWRIFNLDKDHLLTYDCTLTSMDGMDRNKEAYHLIISKKDGSLIKKIPIPFEKIRTWVFMSPDFGVIINFPAIKPTPENWLLVESSSDTVYTYNPAKDRMEKLLAHTYEGEQQYLLKMGPVTPDYYFMQSISKAYDAVTGRGFPTAELVYDRNEKNVYQLRMESADITDCSINLFSFSNNPQVAFSQTLESAKLLEQNEEGGLSGKLKEVAARLGEEDNPVIMIGKYKE